MKTSASLPARISSSLMVDLDQILVALRVEGFPDRPREIHGLALAPVIEKHNARLLMGHVLMDGDDADVPGTHGLEHRLQLAFRHGEIAVDHGLIIRAGKRCPGIDAHFAADGHAVHPSRPPKYHLEHAVARLAFLRE